MNQSAGALCVCLGVLVAGCTAPVVQTGASTGRDAGLGDAADVGSAAALDAGAAMGSDAGLVDGDAVDAGTSADRDAGNVDAGSDAGLSDAGPDSGPSAACGCNTPDACYGPADAGDPYSACPNGTICDLSGQCVSPHYTLNGDGTVTDNVTGLVWQQNIPAQQFNCTWAQADDYCNNLVLGGIAKGWRLPTRPELYSLIEQGSFDSIDQTAFPGGLEGGPYWTSPVDTEADGYTYAWVVNFGIPASSIGNGTPQGTDSVRCVR